MLKPQHCTWYEIKQNPQWVHLQYFHPAVYCSTIRLAGWAPTQSPFRMGQRGLTWTEDPHSGIPPFREEGEGKKNYSSKAGNSLYTSKAYILSEQNVSFYLYAKILRLDALKSRVWSQCTAMWDTYRWGNWKALGPSEKRTSMEAISMGSQCGESSPGVIWYLSLFVNTSALNIGIYFLEQILKMIDQFICKILFICFFKKVFFFVFLQKPE